MFLCNCNDLSIVDMIMLLDHPGIVFFGKMFHVSDALLELKILLILLELCPSHHL